MRMVGWEVDWVNLGIWIGVLIAAILVVVLISHSAGRPPTG